MDELINKLVPIGLTDKEARVYIALLQLGRSSAYGIATKSGLKKPTAYVILGQLIEKGLAVEVPREKKQLFAPRPPEDFIIQAERRVLEAKSALPELASLFKKVDTGKVRTMYFEGVNGMRQALWYKEKELRGKEVVGFFASGKQATPEVVKLFYEWHEHYLKHDIKIRGICTYDETIKSILDTFFNDRNEAVKFLPHELYDANVSIDSGEDFVRIDLVGVEQIVIVESAEFAKMFRQVFEMAWKYFPTMTLNEARTKTTHL